MGVKLEDTGEITRLDMEQTSRILNIKPLKFKKFASILLIYWRVISKPYFTFFKQYIIQNYW